MAARVQKKKKTDQAWLAPRIWDSPGVRGGTGRIVPRKYLGIREVQTDWGLGNSPNWVWVWDVGPGEA